MAPAKYIHRYPYGSMFIEEKWFKKYVDPEIDGMREPVAGCGQLCRLSEKSDGKLIFHPATEVEYKRGVGIKFAC